MRKSLFILCLLASSPLFAANITNAITGIGPKDAAVSPYFCIQNGNGDVTYALAPGTTIDGNYYSGNQYYVGGTLRFGGCGSSNAYLGYLGLNVNAQHSNKISSYTPPEGIHITFASPSIDGNGVIKGSIKFTAIQSNFDILTKAPSQNKNWMFVGTNLSGLEFNKMIDPFVIPNLSKEDANTKLSDLADVQAFLNAGMNTMRVPVRWAYLQQEGPGKGNINLEYYDSFVKPLLQSLTSAKVHTIVDLHAYMRYAIFGKEYAGCMADSTQCPEGKLIIDPVVYQDIWTKLYTLIKNDPKIDKDYIILDLMNEPVDVPDDAVFTIQTHLIKALRQQGFTGYILVEGNSWTGLHSWFTTRWLSKDGKTTYTNGTLFTRDNFAKAGITDLSKVVINVHQYLDKDYSGVGNVCVTELNTTGDNGYNLMAFVDYLQQNHLKAMVTEFGGGTDSVSCSLAMTKFLNYLQDNAARDKDYGFIGWTIWSAGHGWGDYSLRVTPTSYHMQVLKNYL